MNYTAHQKKLINGMVAKQDKWMAMDEMWTQLSTDAERTKQSYKLPKGIVYDPEEAEQEAEDWAFITESEQEQLQEAEALNNI